MLLEAVLLAVEGPEIEAVLVAADELDGEKIYSVLPSQ